MKSKFLLTVFLGLLSINLLAQPLNWREDSPSDFIPLTVLPDFDNYTQGTKSAKIIFSETGTPYFVSDTFDITSGGAYSFTIDVLDNDPGGEVNQRIRFINADGTGTNHTSTVYTTDNPAFQTLTFAGTAPATAVKAYVIIRIYDVSANWTSSAVFNLDNASFTQGGSNLIANPDFESWKAIDPLSTIKNWKEDSPSDFVPMTIVPEQTIISHGLTSVKITFTETGTPYFVSDTFSITSGAEYNYSIDVLDNDPGAEINQRIRFINADGSGTNHTSGSYTVDNVNFQTLTFTGTAPATAVKTYVILRIYDVSASWTGSGTFYLDKASFTQGGANLLANPSFEDWIAPTGKPEFLSYRFNGLTPNVVGTVDKMTHTVGLTVPYATELNGLVATFTLTEGATAKVGETEQTSELTPNDFTNPVSYTLTAEDAVTTQEWVVTVSKAAPSSAKEIISFRFEALNPPSTGVINAGEHSISIEVPHGTNVTALVPNIALSDFATVSPASGVAQNFTNPVNYTVTAQDGTQQVWVVSVTFAAAGQTTLFYEDFENLPENKIPSSWVLINNDGYTQAAGEERWQDSAWVVTTSSRTELAGTKVAMASSYCSNMPLDGHADDWMILPKITLGANSTLSWQALSTTSSGNYPDDYMVLIAPAVNGVTPTVSYFEAEGNILVTVAPESWSAFVGNPGQGLKSRSINLKSTSTASAPDGWFNRDVWIAFALITDRYTNPNTGIPNSTAGGSNLALDNIKVVNNTLTSIKETRKNELNVSLFPNPTAGEFKLSVKAEKPDVAEIEIFDLAGKMVLQKTAPVKTGENQLEMNVSNLNEGIYMIKTRVNGMVNVSKLILR